MQLVKPSVFHTFPVVFWLPVYCKICHLLVPSFQPRLCQSFLGIQTDHNLPTSTSSMLTSAGTPPNFLSVWYLAKAATELGGDGDCSAILLPEGDFLCVNGKITYGTLK